LEYVLLHLDCAQLGNGFDATFNQLLHVTWQVQMSASGGILIGLLRNT